MVSIDLCSCGKMVKYDQCLQAKQMTGVQATNDNEQGRLVNSKSSFFHVRLIAPRMRTAASEAMFGLGLRETQPAHVPVTHVAVRGLRDEPLRTSPRVTRYTSADKMEDILTLIPIILQQQRVV